ncbi:methyltransferase [Kribbella endophytica]
MNDRQLTQRVADLSAGFIVSQALYAVAELNIATPLAAGPLTIGQLAAATGLDAGRLERVIRFLEPVGVFRRQGDLIELDEIGTTIVEGGVGYDIARFWVGTHYLPLSDLVGTVKTGAHSNYYGKPFFDHVVESPERMQVMSNFMAGYGNALREGTFDAYDLPEGRTVADIGGADGNILLQLIGRSPERQGIVFDLPGVVDGAGKRIAEAGLADRVAVVGGDFFESVPAADLYVMSYVLHDWSDEQCVRILRTIAQAAPPKARLVVFEAVLPEDGTTHPAATTDMIMMTLLGGRERTADQWYTLLAEGGFPVDRIIDTPSSQSIIEATLA